MEALERSGGRIEKRVLNIERSGGRIESLLESRMNGVTNALGNLSLSLETLQSRVHNNNQQHIVHDPLGLGEDDTNISAAFHDDDYDDDDADDINNSK